MDVQFHLTVWGILCRRHMRLKEFMLVVGCCSPQRYSFSCSWGNLIGIYYIPFNVNNALLFFLHISQSERTRKSLHWSDAKCLAKVVTKQWHNRYEEEERSILACSLRGVRLWSRDPVAYGPMVSPCILVQESAHLEMARSKGRWGKGPGSSIPLKDMSSMNYFLRLDPLPKVPTTL